MRRILVSGREGRTSSRQKRTPENWRMVFYSILVLFLYERWLFGHRNRVKVSFFFAFFSGLVGRIIENWIWFVLYTLVGLQGIFRESHGFVMTARIAQWYQLVLVLGSRSDMKNEEFSYEKNPAISSWNRQLQKIIEALVRGTSLVVQASRSISDWILYPIFSCLWHVHNITKSRRELCVELQLIHTFSSLFAGKRPIWWPVQK